MISDSDLEFIENEWQILVLRVKFLIATVEQLVTVIYYRVSASTKYCIYNDYGTSTIAREFYC